MKTSCCQAHETSYAASLDRSRDVDRDRDVKQTARERFGMSCSLVRSFVLPTLRTVNNSSKPLVEDILFQYYFHCLLLLLADLHHSLRVALASLTEL